MNGREGIMSFDSSEPFTGYSKKKIKQETLSSTHFGEVTQMKANV